MRSKSLDTVMNGLPKFTTGLKKPKKKKTVLKRWQPKLSIEQMAEAFELRNSGVYLGNLAEAFGVSHKTFARYIRMAEQEGFDFWRSPQ